MVAQPLRCQVRAFIVPDSHGRYDLVGGLLRQEGLLGAHFQRVDRSTLIVHLGDLINATSETIDRDLRCLRIAPDWLDVYLVGNHEYPYFDGGGFRGYYRDAEIRERLRRFESRNLILPCVAIDGVLVSHAGLSSSRGRKWKTAEEFAEDALQRWRFNKRDAIFDACGVIRYGETLEGGILWADWNESKRMAFNQVVGHTRDKTVRWRRRGDRWAVCIDIGAGRGDKIAGCWLEDGEPRIVEYQGHPLRD